MRPSLALLALAALAPAALAPAALVLAAPMARAQGLTALTTGSAPVSTPAPAIAPGRVTNVGLATLSYDDAVTGRTLALTLWYPATGPGTPITVGGNAVFEGSAAEKGAPIAPGHHPLVLLSHGGLRSAAHSGAWLARRLAASGYIVVTVDGPRLGPEDAKLAIREIADRTHDLSGALDAVLGDSDWAQHIAPDQVSAVGLFLGGTAALLEAGARFDPARFVESCDGKDGTGPGVDCAWFKAGGLDLHKADLAPLARIHRDPRVGFAIAVAPEYAAALTPGSLAKGAVPVAVIDLGPDAKRPPGMTGKPLDGATPVLNYIDLTGVTRFDAFTQCTSKGAEILRDSGSDAPICDDSGAKREAAHADLASTLRTLLGTAPN